MSGRGAWNNSGLGGTKKYKNADAPGPYYFLGTGEDSSPGDPNKYAVHRAVLAYQRALNRRLDEDVATDGYFGPETSDAVTAFQEKHSDQTGTPWGGIGPQTSEALLYPDLRRIHRKMTETDTRVTINMVSGTIRHESGWDAGAVGFIDPRDVGLAQINAEAHPEWSTNQRLRPGLSFKFVISYYKNALNQLHGNQRDAVASYNLGIGGARQWIDAGRPDMWTPAGSTTERNVKQYIDSILEG